MTERPVVVVWRAANADHLPGIEAAGTVADIRFAPDVSALRPALDQAEVLFFHHGSKPELEAAWPLATKLRWIQSASDGVDGLLFPALVESGVEVTNGRGVFDDAIAEWVIGAMLAMVTGLDRSIVSQTERHWDDDRGTERLAGKRFLAVGPGPIGRAAARRARDLGMSVAAVGRAPRPDDLFERIGGPGDLHPMLAEADVVLDALPLSSGTHHFFDAAAFAAMKPTARFLNVGRGATVDEAALVAALEPGAIGGAALDVFEEEPLPESSPLWTLPTVIVSPHICGDFDGWERAVVDVFLDNLGRFVRGETLRNRVDTRAGFGIG